MKWGISKQVDGCSYGSFTQVRVKSQPELGVKR